MPDFATTFRADEDGAVTVDWVVLTAAIVGLGVAIATIIFPITEGVAGDVDAMLLANSSVDTDLDGE